MRKIIHLTLFIFTSSILISCAGMLDESKIIPTTGKAQLLGMKPDGTYELILTAIDGKTIGNLPYDRTYEIELDPGTHKIKSHYFFTWPSTNMTTGSSIEEVEINVTAGHVYKIRTTTGGSIQVEDLTTGKVIATTSSGGNKNNNSTQALKKKETYKEYCAQDKEWKLSEKKHAIELLSKLNNCLKPSDIKHNKTRKEDSFSVSCQDKTLEFSCTFDDKCTKQCWRN